MLRRMASPETTLAPDLQPAMAKVNELFNVEVIGKRNFSALDQIYTEDARILPPGAPMISGREAIRGFWRDLVQGGNIRSAVLESSDVMASGDAAVEIGKATITAEAGPSMDVKYVVYWRREGGQWKWHVDIWNTNS
jgi:ketosteroid isomerase-like protein